MSTNSIKSEMAGWDFWEEFFRRFRLMEEEVCANSALDPDEPATFQLVMEIDDPEERARVARSHDFPPEYLLLASSGSGPEALINYALCETEER